MIVARVPWDLKNFNRQVKTRLVIYVAFESLLFANVSNISNSNELFT